MAILRTAVDIARVQIKKSEGLKLKPYYCPAGKLTVGYGTNLEQWPHPVMLIKGKIKKAVAEDMLIAGVNVAVGDAIKYFRDLDRLDKERQAVIIDMAYNLGLDRLKKFVNLRKALQERDFQKAYDEMLDSKWHRDFVAWADGEAHKTRSFQLATIMKGSTHG